MKRRRQGVSDVVVREVERKMRAVDGSASRQIQESAGRPSESSNATSQSLHRRLPSYQPAPASQATGPRRSALIPQRRPQRPPSSPVASAPRRRLDHQRSNESGWRLARWRASQECEKGYETGVRIERETNPSGILRLKSCRLKTHTSSDAKKKG